MTSRSYKRCMHLTWPTFVSSFFVLLLSTYSSLGASSEWWETDGAKMRIVSETTPLDGIIKAALQIELDSGWKTYWREPGSSGIPPQIDFSNSMNLKEAQLLFPAPILIDDGYGAYAGYKKSVSLPIELHVNGDEFALNAEIFIGVCSDICVPFSATANMDLSNLETSHEEADLIEAAWLQLPSPQGEDFKLVSSTHNEANNTLEMRIKMPGFYPKSFKPEVFLHGPSGFALSQPKLMKIEDGFAHFESELFDKLDQIEDTDVQFYTLLKLGQRSVETTIQLKR